MTKRVLSLFLILTLALSLFPVSTLAADAPDVTIATVEQFRSFADAVNGGESYEGNTVVLAANLDLAGKLWTPIGSNGKPFKGTFNGQYHSITGLHVSQAGYAGLFGYLGSGGTIQDLAVQGTVENTSNYAGGVVAYNSGTVSHCLNKVKITSEGDFTGYYTAGIAGDNHGSIFGCVNLGDITGTTALGGIAGMSVGQVENCYNLGAVTSTSGNHVGGIVGQMRSMGSAVPSMLNCYGAGTVTGSASNLGSLIGQHQSGSVTNCHYLETAAAKGIGSGSATATPFAAGGLDASTLGGAFEPGADHPVLSWEKDMDVSSPVGPAFPEASDTSVSLSNYIRAAISAKKSYAGLAGSDSLLHSYTTSSTDTDWIAVTMGRYGYQDGDVYRFLYNDGNGYTDYLAALQDDVTEKYEAYNGLLHDKKATEWQRLILAVNAIGGDPTTFGSYNGQSVDLVNDGTYNHQNPGWQGINGSIFGLIALDSRNYDVPANAVTTREQFIQDILDLQLSDGVNGNALGGWALSGTASDPDITAMAIQALAPYYNTGDTVRAAVNAALDKLGALQTADGGFASWGTVNSESTAQVLVALCSLGIDPAGDARFIKDGKTLLDDLLTFRLPDGSFSHTKPLTYNSMATDQASYALVSYWRFENGLRALYDMRHEWTQEEYAAISAAVDAINSLPAPGADGYKGALKSALAQFRQIDQSERRYVSNYNALATAIERIGGEDALDSTGKYPVSLTITTPPAKTAYTEGETFDPAGMVVTLTYSDGSTEALIDYVLQPTGKLTLNDHNITVSYGGFTVQTSIAVREQAPWEGSGTESDPYLIQNLADLETLRAYTHDQLHCTQTVWDAHFLLTTDLDMSGVTSWTAIGSSKPFGGHFDGGGHVLKNYDLTDAWNCGIFGTVDGGSVKNLGVANGTITMYSNSSDNGVLVNTLQNGGLVEHCWNAAKVTFKGGYSGAIVGSIRRGKNNSIIGCYNLGNISGPEATGPLGGIIGYSDSGSDSGSGVTLIVRDCYNRGDITSQQNMGGILAHCRDGVLMSGCYNTGKITATNTNPAAPSRVGALLGVANNANVINCHYLADNIEIQTEGGAEITPAFETGEAKTAEEMKSAEFLTTLDAGNGSYKADRENTPINSGYPVLSWQEFPPLTDPKPDAPNPVDPPSPDPLKAQRIKALASLKAQYEKFIPSDYSAENRALLTSSYEKGVQDIQAAKPAAAPYQEKNIIAALNAALNAMQAIQPDKAGKITVAVSVDASTLGLGYLVKPTLVETTRYTKASAVLTDLLAANGYSWNMTGSIENSFYLAGIRPVDQTKAVVAPFIVNAIGGEGNILYSDRTDTNLSEFDYYNMSGWMYCVDGSFPGVSASNWSLGNGEVMRWQFTVYGYGADLNADNSSWGQPSLVPNLGNKDALTWDVAALRGQYSDSVLNGSAAYASALKLLVDPTATQSALDSAKRALATAKFETSAAGGAASGGPVVTDTVLPERPPAFSDVPDGYWAKNAVDFVATRGLFLGTGDGVFSPSLPMTRAMLATVLYRLGRAAPGASNPFSDVPDHAWYADAVAWAADAGIVEGSGGSFAPNRTASRQEIVAMLYRYAKSLGLDMSQTADLSGYADSAAIAPWAVDSMTWAVAEGLVRGRTETSLDPGEAVTRAEVAVIFQRFAALTESKNEGESNADT